METATIKSWPEWLHWCSVSFKSNGQWPERGSRVATYWLKDYSYYSQLNFMFKAAFAWEAYKIFISEREKSKQDASTN